MKMKLFLSVFIMFTGIFSVCSEEIILDGGKLMPSDVVKVAKHHARVTLSDEAVERVRKSHNILLVAAEKGHDIYGLTVGVGLNKDQKMIGADGGLSEEVVRLSEEFNQGLIYAHSAGVGPEMSKEVVRAIMVTRLNSILFGSTGVQLRVAEMYRDFLNSDIVPVIPSRGSVGEADITLITHIGLAMIGEGMVYYKGEKMSAGKALKQARLQALVPFGKDSLAILSSNAYSEALAAMAVEELSHGLEVAKFVFALSIQGLNGNIEPFLEHSNSVRPFPFVNKVAEDIRNILHDSYLWGKSEDRPLQDPLSYRTAAYTFGAVENSLTELRDIVRIQLNSSDDNPGVIPDVSPPSERYEERIHYVHEDDLTGAVLPTSNFSPLPWVISLQKAGIALAHASNASAQRTIKLADPHFTKLKRFLGTESTIHAYGAIQKVFSSLATENQELARPVSFNFFAIAGNIEDVATNAPMVARRIRKIIDNYYHILGIELMHAAQAIDLRLQQNPDLKLSAATRIFFDEYRRTVPFMEKDRVLTGDIEHSYHFLKGYDPKP